MNINKKIMIIKAKMHRLQVQLDFYKEIKQKRSTGSTVQESFEECLTAKQAEILEFVLKGLTNDDIADVLNVSVKTVKFHKTGIFAIFQVNNSEQLRKLLLSDQGIYEKLKKIREALYYNIAETEPAKPVEQGPAVGSTPAVVAGLYSGTQTSGFGISLPLGKPATFSAN